MRFPDFAFYRNRGFVLYLSIILKIRISGAAFGAAFQDAVCHAVHRSDLRCLEGMRINVQSSPLAK